MVVVGTVASWCDHVESLRALSYLATNASSSRAILRTLVEAWITCQYVALDRDGARARTYLLEHARGQVTFYRRLLKMAQRSTEERDRILSILGLSSLRELERQLRDLDAEMGSLRAAHGLERKLRPLEQRAAAVSPEAELIYAQVYAFLFSDDVHMGAEGAVAPILTTRARTMADVEKVLVTAEALTKDMTALVERETSEL
jgi:hypothetical protein